MIQDVFTHIVVDAAHSLFLYCLMPLGNCAANPTSSVNSGNMSLNACSGSQLNVPLAGIRRSHMVLSQSPRLIKATCRTAISTASLSLVFKTKPVLYPIHWRRVRLNGNSRRAPGNFHSKAHLGVIRNLRKATRSPPGSYPKL